MSDFDWNEAAKAGDIIVRSQDAIAVYENDDGDIVIRRQADPYIENEDVFVVIPLEKAIDVARKIVDVANQSGDD
ncbi:hypothetical protein [Neorhizobium sp. NCHU2750]|uniref:hypothetical protein n=1 Tax=Neorhizobium sp. NCHU2750 TaxID=1825976 RepID=UPI000E72A875|nr:hypothetical protein NCHU2750_28340 [Neorhizobium sp. NCHU2750]